MQNTDRKNIFNFILAIAMLIFYFFNSRFIVEYSKQALLLCYETVIPSLFIFMVITTFLSTSKYIGLLGLPFKPFFRILNINNNKLISYCLLGIIGGFATGGYFLDKIQKEFDCCDNLAGILSILMSNNSPAFVIVAVGGIMLKHFSSGVILYFSVVLSCFITAFIFSFLFPYSSALNTKSTSFYDNSLAECVTICVKSILNICGIVITAFIVCKAVSLYTQNSFILAFFSSFCEITTACTITINQFGNNLYLLCFALSFCPLSTYLQLKIAVNNPKFNFRILWLSKIVQVPLSLIILRIAINLFPQAFAVFSSNDISVKLYWNLPKISIYLFILSILFVIYSDKKIKVFTIDVK